jgi:hypothetical protein
MTARLRITLYSNRGRSTHRSHLRFFRSIILQYCLELGSFQRAGLLSDWLNFRQTLFSRHSLPPRLEPGLCDQTSLIRGGQSRRLALFEFR